MCVVATEQAQRLGINKCLVANLGDSEIKINFQSNSSGTLLCQMNIKR